jgi:uncharacterized membrane protein
VPVIIGAVLGGPLVGTFIGLIFGLSSMILAAVAPTGPGDVFFTNPWVSVVPRLFIGVAAWGAYRLAQAAGRKGTMVIGGIVLAAITLAIAYTIGTGAADPETASVANPAAAVVIAAIGLALVALMLVRAARAHPEEIALSLAAVAGTLTNTLLVLGVLVLRDALPAAMALTIGVVNGPAEMAGAALLTVAVVVPWKQIVLRPERSSV